MMNYINQATKMMGLGLFVLSALFALRPAFAAPDNLVTPEHLSPIKTTVELPLQGAVLEYKADVRLLQVLDDANSNGSLGYFPLSAQLFDKTNIKAIEIKKRNVLRQLEALAVENPEAKLVVQQLSSFQYLNRIFIELDRNAVISQSGKNPLLVPSFNLEKSLNQEKISVSQTQGFSLYLPHRSTSIQLIGVMKGSVRMNLIEHGTLNDYLDALPNGFLGESVDKSVAYVVQPDGVVQTIQYAYWNEQPVYLAPGAIVFMAFYSLPSEYSTLNQDIVDLLRHKVGL